MSPKLQHNFLRFQFFWAGFLHAFTKRSSTSGCLWLSLRFELSADGWSCHAEHQEWTHRIQPAWEIGEALASRGDRPFPPGSNRAKHSPSGALCAAPLSCSAAAMKTAIGGQWVG